MKRIAVLLAAVIAALSLSSALPLSAAGSHGYVAFGDSIAFGYGLSSVQTQCFTNLVAKELDLTFNNYAVNGMTSAGLLQTLQALPADSATYGNLASASLITVTIGSNDLLGPLDAVWQSAMQAAGGVLDEAAYAILEASLTSSDATASFDAGIASYTENLPQIYAVLREANPTAQIIMTRFYNPYYGVMLGSFDFSAMCDGYICRMNDVLTAGADTMDYTVADSYTPFNAAGMTNVDLSAESFDPHPNVDGHAAIRDAVLAAVDKDAIAAMNSATETAPETTAETAIETAPESDSATDTETAAQDAAADKFPTGAAILIGIAAAAFIVTGVIITKKQKKKK